MKSAFNVVVCASGGGGNFQALIDAKKENTLDIDIKLLIVDKDCGAIERAVKNNIEYLILDSSKGKENLFLEFEKALPNDTNLIVLAGFMPIIPRNICERWQGKIINTHPSLLPQYGGKGMYGIKVHEAVMQARELRTGCTVHFVNSEVDGGEIILQKSIDIDYQLTPWELGGLVFKEENKLLVEAIRLLKSRFEGKS